MGKRIIMLLCISSCFISKAISQYSFNRHQFFGENNRNSTFYTYADSSNDTVRSVVFKDSAKRSSSRSIVIMEEIGIGTLIGTGLSLPCGWLAFEIRGERDWDFAAIAYGMYGGFTLGYSYGVYIIAKREKPNVSFWGILASELIGSGIGFGINIASNHNGAGRWTPIVFPIAFPIIYVELFE